MTSITSKTTARREAKYRLERLSGEDKQRASAAIRDHLATWPAYLSAQRIALFAGLANEPDLLSMIDLDRGCDGGLGKTFCLPRVDGDAMGMFSVADPKDLKPGRFGILEPDLETANQIPAESIDLVLAPGVAFGLQGERLGRGGGYFDRFLPKLREGRCVVGICFECQIFTSLPIEDHDVPVEAVISEKGVRTV